MRKTFDKKNIAKEILGQDFMKRIVSKSTNQNYAPWKNEHYEAKDTPFGNFPKQRTKKKEPRKGNIFEEQASTQILLNHALQAKKSKEFGIKMTKPKQGFKKDVFAPKTDLKFKKRIEPSQLPMFYDRGDLPLQIEQEKGAPSLKWLIDPIKLDYKFYLPLFFDGLRERKDPYRIIALLGTIDLLDAGGLKVLETVPQLILPLKKGFNTRDMDIMKILLKVIQKLASCNKYVGQALVPYYRQLLPPMNLFKSRTKTTYDKVSTNERFDEDLAELIQETLEVLEQTGGEDAYIHIKYMIPTFQKSI